MSQRRATAARTARRRTDRCVWSAKFDVQQMALSFHGRSAHTQRTYRQDTERFPRRCGQGIAPSVPEDIMLERRLRRFQLAFSRGRRHL